MDPAIRSIRTAQAHRMVDSLERVADSMHHDPFDQKGLEALQSALQSAVVEVTMMRAVLLATSPADKGPVLA